jgi:acylphosphatase
MKQLTLHLNGKVQGVFFRFNAKKQADRLDLAGFVKNLSDGRVKIVAQGERVNSRSLLVGLNRDRI